MASVADTSTKEDLTTCSICVLTFKTPKYFPCLHSFCEGCIKTYIAATFQMIKGGVNCPVCQMFVSKPADVSVEEWSLKLPTNQILVNLINVNERKSGQNLCTACTRVNETERACSWCTNCSEALCKECVRYHQKNKASLNHRLVDLDNNYSTEILLQLADSLCTEHSDKKLEAFCYDHNAICCTTCVMLKHRLCENVSSVEDAAEKMKQSKEVEKFEDHLQDLKQKLEALVKDRGENLQKFDASVSKVTSEIDTLFKMTWNHLKDLKRTIMNDISITVKEVRTEIEDRREEFKYKISAVENILALFHTYMKYASPVSFLQAIDKLSDQRSMLENFVTDKSQKIIELGVIYEPNEKLVEMKKVIQEFGRVEISKTIKLRSTDNDNDKTQ